MTYQEINNKKIEFTRFPSAVMMLTVAIAHIFDILSIEFTVIYQTIVYFITEIIIVYKNKITKQIIVNGDYNKVE
jgi:hypothetical protein